jgi:hypothetical protein
MKRSNTKDLPGLPGLLERYLRAIMRGLPLTALLEGLKESRTFLLHEREIKDGAFLEPYRRMLSAIVDSDCE